LLAVKVGQGANRRICQDHNFTLAGVLLRTRKNSVSARFILFNEVVIGVQEIQGAVPNHGCMLRPCAGNFELEWHPASFRDVAQDWIPELRGQGWAAVDDDAKR